MNEADNKTLIEPTTFEKQVPVGPRGEYCLKSYLGSTLLRNLVLGFKIVYERSNGDVEEHGPRFFGVGGGEGVEPQEELARWMASLPISQ